MEDKRKKLLDLKPIDIVRKWGLIVFLTYVASWIIIGGLTKLFIKTGFYVEYYENFIVSLLDVPGFTLCLIGLIIWELNYFYNYKGYKNAIILIIILVCVCGITYKYIPYSNSYRYYKDLHYVMEGTYCEDVQGLKNIYINNVTSAKHASTKIYIETTDFKFQVVENIVEEKDFNKFKSKFNNVKKVKIRYLPNSEILLSIEPISD